MFVISHPLHAHSFPSSWNRGAYYYHYPFFRAGCGRNNCNSTNDVEDGGEKEEKPVVLKHMEHDVIDHDKFYSINIETPGIKAKDIHVTVDKERLIHVTAERKDSDDNTTLIKYEQKFGVNKRKHELSKVNALYEDGVLCITVPKKQKIEVKMVDVVSEYPPVRENSTNEEQDGTDQNEEQDGTDQNKKNSPFEYTVDLPGVKPSAVKVKYDHDEQEVRVEATRVRGSTTLRKHKLFHIDEESVDVEKLQAYLMDGVLTITAPRREFFESKEEDSTTKQMSEDIVVIPVIQGGGDVDHATPDLAVHSESAAAVTEETTNEKTSESTTNDADDKRTTSTKNATNPDGIFFDAVTVETVNEKEDKDK